MSIIYIKKSKRIIAALLMALTMLTAIIVPAFASGSSEVTTANAEHLFKLGLFKGTENGYELDGIPTRVQGMVMLIRLLGKEKEALNGLWRHPFTDVQEWADKYVGYAYDKGLTKGTEATKFSPEDILVSKDYLTMLLRALDYSESKGDFKWETSISDAVRLGIIADSARTYLESVTLNRGDMADLSYAALSKKMSGSKGTLAEKLVSQGVFTREQGLTEGVIGSGWIYTYTSYDGTTTVYSRQTIWTSEGSVTADVIKVNIKNPRVKVKSAMVKNTVGATESFSSIASNSGAAALINGNFFEAYEDFKKPIGHFMSGGEFLYGVSGLTAIGITKTGELKWGRPAVFTRLISEGTQWSAYEINSTWQSAHASVLYTPAFGESVEASISGFVMKISGGIITAFYAVNTGSRVSIPSDGFIFFMGSSYVTTDYFREPKEGGALKVEYYLRELDSEGFSLDGMESVISGGPRLVRNGAADYKLDNGFNEARFTTASTPRSAIGTTSEGKLMMVSVPSATIQQMREIMLYLGCVNAMNLDGGASASMYYNGEFIRKPGRELTTTLQVFVN